MVLSEANLGDGSFSVCRRCSLNENGQEFAVKIISRRVDCSKEIELLSRCQGHPNVVTLVEVLQVKKILLKTWADIHQALLSQFFMASDGLYSLIYITIQSP